MGPYICEIALTQKFERKKNVRCCWKHLSAIKYRYHSPQPYLKKTFQHILRSVYAAEIYQIESFSK